MSAPLQGLSVVEFTHMVMGPTVGAVLAGLGADVIRIEPIGGDQTRYLQGSGAGYFAMYNRDKRSICLDLKSADGLKIAKQLCARADILIENFRPGALDRLGLSFEALRLENPGLIYCSEKGFLPGPYENRTALDEVAQMMGGLAYMTGPPGTPLRAGASVIDVAGGMFGVIAILAAVQERHRTGLGQKVQSSLFETTVYFVGQHMAQMAVTGKPAAPMPTRVSAWAIYDVFATADDNSVFIGVVTDALWEKFCTLFQLSDLGADETLRHNTARVLARARIMPQIRALIMRYTCADILSKLEGSGLPYAPIGRPEDMFDDPHLLASGGLESVTLPDGRETQLPVLPIEMNGARVSALRKSASAQVATPGDHSASILQELGYNHEDISQLFARNTVGKE
jgi:crotonobetainyl-CoA:carnitine CoA-transferase CaiB-like acyl-CoA transferase